MCFYPKNIDYLARRKLRDIRQIGLVQDYVKMFTMIMLDICDMIKKNELFFFLDGLLRDATIEFKGEGFRTWLMW